MENLVIGNELAKKLAQQLNLDFVLIEDRVFPDGEVQPRLEKEEKANKAINLEEDDRNGMLEKLLESIDSGNYENFKKDLDYDLKEKFTEEEFNKLANEVKEKYGEYKIYSTEFISSNTGSRITTAYFYTIYSKNQKVKIMIKFSLEIEIHKIADFRFGS